MSVGPIADTTALEAYRNGDPQKALDDATADVRSLCGWHVAPALTETIRVGPVPGGYRFLPSLHITEITAVRVDGVAVDLADVTWTRSGSIYVKGSRDWGDERVLEVDLTHGYDPVPADLAGVVMARAARKIGDPAGNLAARTRGPFAEQYNTGGVAGFNPSVESDVIARYRIPRSR